MNRLLKTSRNLGHSHRLFAAMSGTLAACCLISGMAPFRLALSNSLVIDAAILFVAMACVALLRTSSFFNRLSRSAGSFGLMMAALAALVAPALITKLLQALGNVSLISLARPELSALVAVSLSGIVLLPLCLGIGCNLRQQRQLSATGGFDWLISFSIGGILAVTLLLPMLGNLGLACVCFAVSGLLVGWQRWKFAAIEAVLPGVNSSHVAKSAAARWGADVMSFAIGGGLAIALSVSSQLVPRSLITDVALAAGVIFGCGWSLRARPLSLKSTSPINLSWITLAAWVTCIVAAYPFWTFFHLKLNAHVSSLFLLMLGRVLFLMMLTAPAGILIQRAALTRAADRALQPLLVFAGFLIVSLQSVSPAAAAMVLGVAALLLAIAQSDWKTGFASLGRLQKLKAGALATVALAGLSLTWQLDYRRSEKILFSGQTLQQARNGGAIDQLYWMDDGRFVAGFDSIRDRTSLWKYRGSQILIRQDGLTTGMISTDPRIAPQSASDILPMLVPLAFHPSPEDVLIVGVHPAALMTCQNYPLRMVRTLDSHRGAHEVLGWLESHVPDWQLSGGAEFQFGHVDPMLSIYSRHDCAYDLVVCPLTHPAVTQSISETSREFYQAVARHLKEGGLFAQRIPYYDLSPNIIASIAATMRSVFPEVSILETIPGELVFLCARDQLPRIDDALVERFKAPQCRQLLGDAGWDWSMVLGRGGLTNEEVKTFVASQAQMNQAADARWCAGLPLEVCRWGAKAEATRATLAQSGDALRSALTQESLSQEVSHRLEDLNLAHQLQMGHPNDPWGYRKALKERLQDRPRTALVHVNYEGLKRVLDPEDSRRKDYLKALGEVIHSEQPTPEQIINLTGYESPFDPLVSLFVHHESVQLLDRCEIPDRNLQYKYLMKTVYFANTQDQSVRNASRALALACEEEHVTLSPEERWDHVNSLLQTLAQRWQMRWNSGHVSKYDAVDTEQSVLAVERGMKLLESTASQSGLTTAEWESRAAILEASLVRPLRQKRSAQLRRVPLATPSAHPPTAEAPTPPGTSNATVIK